MEGTRRRLKGKWKNLSSSTDFLLHFPDRGGTHSTHSTHTPYSETFATSIFHSTQPFLSQINLTLPPWHSLSLGFSHTVPSLIPHILLPKQVRAGSSYQLHKDAHFLQNLQKNKLSWRSLACECHSCLKS